jgi:hypothetical protein
MNMKIKVTLVDNQNRDKAALVAPYKSTVNTYYAPAAQTKEQLLDKIAINLRDCIYSWNSIGKLLNKLLLENTYGQTNFGLAEPSQEFVMEVEVTKNWNNYTVTVKENGKERYNGALAYLKSTSLTPLDNLEDKLGKLKAGQVVTFKYNGGSDNGGVRAVKVKSYSYGKLSGEDLVKGDIRTYLKERIENFEVKV